MYSLSKMASLTMLCAIVSFNAHAESPWDLPERAVSVVSAPVLVDPPRPHIDPQSAPQLAHYAHNSDVDDVVLGKDKKIVEAGKANASSLALGLDCSIDGGDLLLANLGADIADGARVKWRAAGDRGAIALPHGLRTGQTARVSDAVALNSGTCSAEVI